MLALFIPSLMLILVALLLEGAISRQKGGSFMGGQPYPLKIQLILDLVRLVPLRFLTFNLGEPEQKTLLQLRCTTMLIILG
ncbi:hypothetical protein JY96_06760 [Aquabacterium sp. NJ1]|nr:hypothetical protein JY96_06760 [Aquabacterium sp. NJ1]